MNPDDIIIEQVKTYSEEVAEAISVFVTKLGDRYQPFTDDSLREIINSPQSYLFIAIHVPTKEVAGMIMEIVYRIPYTTKAYIEDLFVDENFARWALPQDLCRKHSIPRKRSMPHISISPPNLTVSKEILYMKN